MKRHPCLGPRGRLAKECHVHPLGRAIAEHHPFADGPKVQVRPVTLDRDRLGQAGAHVEEVGGSERGEVLASSNVVAIRHSEPRSP